MEQLRFLICLVVGFLGLLAFVLGIVAEVKRVRVGDIAILDDGTCLYPTSPAEALGIVSALALLVAVVIVNAAAGCVCCCGGTYRSSCKKAIAIICLVVSWLTFLSAFSTLMVGAIVSGQHKTSIDSQGYYTCAYIKSGYFAGGAVLGLISVPLGIIYYILASEVKKSSVGGPTHNQNIAMAQPSGKP